MGNKEKKIKETQDSWSSQEKETRPSKILIRIEDCHLDWFTEWFGVRSEEEEGRASIYSLKSTGAVKMIVHGELHIGPCIKDIIADVFITGRYPKALVMIIKKACHPEGCPPSS